MTATARHYSDIAKSLKMPFLVVKTIEDGIPCVAACPDTWVEGSRLYWPKECVNIDKIRSNDKIKPRK